MYKETDPCNADLRLRAKNHMEVFIAHDREMIEPAQKVAAGNRSPLSRDRSRPNADPYAMAPAKLRQSRLAGRRQAIVTEERDKPGRIPDVARRYGMECVNLDGMVGEEGGGAAERAAEPRPAPPAARAAAADAALPAARRTA